MLHCSDSLDVCFFISKHPDLFLFVSVLASRLGLAWQGRQQDNHQRQARIQLACNGVTLGRCLVYV